jgi:hypothetical protein
VTGASCADLNKGLSEVTGAACPEMSPNVNAVRTKYSEDERANVKLRAFIQSAKDLALIASQAENAAAEACTRMGTDLGLPPAQLAPSTEPGRKAEAPCNAVAAAIDSILRSGLQIRVSATPPACQANGQAYAECSGTCQVDVDPGRIVATCEPAKLSGYCQGTCNGRCEGRCGGQCRGQCSQVDAQGRCVGQCNGECSGSCDATCHASCNGTWQAPRCEGSVQGPSADAECDASCRAHASFSASCTPAVVQVEPSANTELAMRLATTLRNNLPTLLHAQIAFGRRVLADAEVLGQVGANLPNILGQAGAHALACVGASAQATANATFSLKVSVQASANVSGRVGVGG